MVYRVLVDGQVVAEMETDDATYAQQWLAEHSAKAPQDQGAITTETGA
jgi:sRNA-binding protein